MIETNYDLIHSDLDFMPQNVLWTENTNLPGNDSFKLNEYYYDNENQLNNNSNGSSNLDLFYMESTNITDITNFSCQINKSESNQCNSINEDDRDQRDARLIDDKKRDLIKATLNFTIKSRRRSLGLQDIELRKEIKCDEDKSESWNPENDEKKMSRRERNRIAARKCRKNRKIKFISLNKEMESLSNLNNNLKNELVKLTQENQELEELLNSHQPQCYLQAWASDTNLSSETISSSDESHRFISYISEIHGELNGYEQY